MFVSVRVSVFCMCASRLVRSYDYFATPQEYDRELILNITTTVYQFLADDFTRSCIKIKNTRSPIGKIKRHALLIVGNNAAESVFCRYIVQR